MAVDYQNHTRRVSIMCELHIKCVHVHTRHIRVLYTGTHMPYNLYASKILKLKKSTFTISSVNLN